MRCFRIRERSVRLDAKLFKAKKKYDRLEKKADKAERDYAWTHSELKHLNRAMERWSRGESSDKHEKGKGLEKDSESRHKGGSTFGRREEKRDLPPICKVNWGSDCDLSKR